MRSVLFHELLEERPVRPVPHRSDSVFRGVVNVQGEMQLCVSLANFLGLDRDSGESVRMSHIVYPRMALVEGEGYRWVFPLNEVHDIHRFNESEILQTPSTVSKATAVFTTGIIRWQGRNVGVLNDELLFGALARRIA